MGTGLLDTAIAAAFIPSALASVPAGCESDASRKLYALCRELQRQSGSETFYLACRIAGEAIGVNVDSASNLLSRMVAEGVLAITEKHTTTRATRYRFIHHK